MLERDDGGREVGEVGVALDPGRDEKYGWMRWREALGVGA